VQQNRLGTVAARRRPFSAYG